MIQRGAIPILVVIDAQAPGAVMIPAALFGASATIGDALRAGLRPLGIHLSAALPAGPVNPAGPPALHVYWLVGVEPRLALNFLSA